LQTLTNHVLHRCILACDWLMLGMRGVVLLRNHMNFATDFSWNPVLGERGTAFSIRPAAGAVNS